MIHVFDLRAADDFHKHALLLALDVEQAGLILIGDVLAEMAEGLFDGQAQAMKARIAHLEPVPNVLQRGQQLRHLLQPGRKAERHPGLGKQNQ